MASEAIFTRLRPDMRTCQCGKTMEGRPCWTCLQKAAEVPTHRYEGRAHAGCYCRVCLALRSAAENGWERSGSKLTWRRRTELWLVRQAWFRRGLKVALWLLDIGDRRQRDFHNALRGTPGRNDKFDITST